LVKELAQLFREKAFVISDDWIIALNYWTAKKHGNVTLHGLEIRFHSIERAGPGKAPLANLQIHGPGDNLRADVPPQKSFPTARQNPVHSTRVSHKMTVNGYSLFVAIQNN
jgi:hypothetical protein